FVRLRPRYALFCHSPPLDLHSFPTRRSSDLLDSVFAYHFRFIEQFRLFRFSAEYAQEHFSYPGGPAFYAASFLIQYYIHPHAGADRKSTRLNSSHVSSSYAVFCLTKKTSTVS